MGRSRQALRAARGRRAQPRDRFAVELVAVGREERRDALGVLEYSADAAGAALSDEALEKELAALSVEERRELVLLWAGDTDTELEKLRDRLDHKIQKKLSIPALRRELEKLGLVAPSAKGGTETPGRD